MCVGDLAGLRREVCGWGGAAGRRAPRAISFFERRLRRPAQDFGPTHGASDVLPPVVAPGRRGEPLAVTTRVRRVCRPAARPRYRNASRSTPQRGGMGGVCAQWWARGLLAGLLEAPARDAAALAAARVGGAGAVG